VCVVAYVCGCVCVYTYVYTYVYICTRVRGEIKCGGGCGCRDTGAWGVRCAHLPQALHVRVCARGRVSVYVCVGVGV